MAKAAQKPKGMHRSFRAATKQVFSPQSTRFLASKSSVQARGRLAFLGIQSKTQKLAWNAQKKVLGNQSAVNIARTSFKQQAYKDALAAKLAKVAARKAKQHPLGMRTKKQMVSNLFSLKKPQFMVNRREARAEKKIAKLQKKVTEYNEKAAVAIAKLAQTNLGKATLKPSANGTVVEKTLSSAMNTLKKAYNAKTSGAVDQKKIELVQLIKQKQNLDNAVIRTRAEFVAATGPEKKAKEAAHKEALAAKEKYKQTGDPQKIKNLIQDLKKTNKVSQIKFNNLYAVAKGTNSGEKIKAQAKLNASTMINGAKQLKREAKYSSLKKTFEYATSEKQQQLVEKIKEADALKATLKATGRLPTRSERKTLRRSLKAQAILRTLGRANYSVTNIDGIKQKSLLTELGQAGINKLKANTEVDILKSPVEKVLGDINVKKVFVDQAKDKVANAKIKMDSNVKQIADIDKILLDLGPEKIKLDAEKIELETQSKNLDSQIASRIENGKLLKTPALIQSNQAEIDKLSKEKETVTEKIKTNGDTIKKNQDAMSSITIKKQELEAENKTLTETITKTTETYTKLDSDFKKEDATIKLAANKEKIGGLEGQKVRLEAQLAAEKLKPTTNTNAMQAIKDIEGKIAAIDVEKKQLEDENKIHTDTITPKVVTPTEPAGAGAGELKPLEGPAVVTPGTPVVAPTPGTAPGTPGAPQTPVAPKKPRTPEQKAAAKAAKAAKAAQVAAAQAAAVAAAVAAAEEKGKVATAAAVAAALAAAGITQPVAAATQPGAAQAASEVKKITPGAAELAAQQTVPAVPKKSVTPLDPTTLTIVQGTTTQVDPGVQKIKAGLVPAQQQAPAVVSPAPVVSPTQVTVPVVSPAVKNKPTAPAASIQSERLYKLAPGGI